MLLMLTGSRDGTADLIVNNSDSAIFRFNIDLINRYRIILEPDYWSLEDPTGRRIDCQTATRAWWWKVFNYGLDADPMYTAEVKYIFREIYSWFAQRNAITGNPPDLENRFGKISQLKCAAESLPTLPTTLRLNVPFPMELLKSAIAKPLTGVTDAQGRVRQTTNVSSAPLDPQYPWFIQSLGIAKADITVLLVGQELFSYSRSRETLTGLDWRSEQLTDSQKWQLIATPHEYQIGIARFAEKAGVNWGRIDFLELEDGSWAFLEYNANGQWGFLEMDCPTGLPAIVARFLCHGPTHGWM